MATINFKNSDLFIASIDQYRMISDFVDGAPSRVLQYVDKYGAESEDTLEAQTAFSGRLRRTYNTNLCDPPLTIHLSHMSQPIDVSGFEGDTAEEILNDITGYGDDITDLVRDALWYYLQHGQVALLADSPAEVSSTKAGAVESGERSYVLLYSAELIREYSYFNSGHRKGKFKSVTLDEGVIEIDGNNHEKLRQLYINEEDEFYSYRILVSVSPVSKVQAAHEEKEYTIIEEGTGQLTSIPFQLIGEGLSESILKDVVWDNRAVINQNSVIANVNYHQGFQRIIIDGMDDSSKGVLKKIGESIINAVRGQINVHKIEAGNPDSLFKERETKIRRAERIALLQFNQLSDDTRQVQSAESKTKDMLARSRYYDYILDMLENALSRVLTYIAEFEGIASDSTSITVNIGRDYGLEDSIGELTKRSLIFQRARELGATDVQKEILKQDLLNLDLVADGGETLNEKRKRLIEGISSLQSAQSPFSFNTFRQQTQNGVPDRPDIATSLNGL